jgi:Protein of unknown function (DUF1115)
MYIHMYTQQQEGDGEGGNAGGLVTRHSTGTSGCLLVWQGVVLQRAFAAFRFQECKTAELARKALESKGVAQYWDMAAHA